MGSSCSLPLALATLCLAAPLLADDGDLDPRYGQAGVAHDPTTGDDAVAGLGCAKDGYCYIGISTTFDDFEVREIAPSGMFAWEVDAVFNLGGSNLDTCRAVAVGADDNPVLVGAAWDATEANPLTAVATAATMSLFI